jgi:Tol biopolymer transport system component
MKRYFLLPLVISFVNVTGQIKRPIVPADVYRLQEITDPQVSPDGNWVAYTLSSVDSAKDKRNEDIWMISWDGKQNIQLTNSPEDESSPRWSPDGKYLSSCHPVQTEIKKTMKMMIKTLTSFGF